MDSHLTNIRALMVVIRWKSHGGEVPAKTMDSSGPDLLRATLRALYCIPKPVPKIVPKNVPKILY